MLKAEVQNDKAGSIRRISDLQTFWVWPAASLASNETDDLSLAFQIFHCKVLHQNFRVLDRGFVRPFSDSVLGKKNLRFSSWELFLSSPANLVPLKLVA